MKILKARRFEGHDKLITFVMDNNIAREDILSIKSAGDYSILSFTMFYYADPEVIEKERNFWGKLE